MVDWWQLLIVVATVVAVFVGQMIMTILAVWGERKIAGFMQFRPGPNRAGPFGILQTVADGVKLLFKESFVPFRADKLVYELAPVLAMVPAFLAFTIVPFGPGFEIGSYEVKMQVADLNVGILWLFSMSAIAVYASMLAGWSSGSKYPLLGGVRAASQVISYELAMGLAVIPVVILAGTLSTQGIVIAQGTYQWFVIPLIVPAIVFYIGALAETNRPPFDLVEADSELVGGYHTEYSGVRFMLFYLAEYVNVITMSAVIVTLFLGGWNGPTPGVLPDALWGFIWFMIKTIILIFTFFWIRVTLPRIRYDELMRFGWKFLMPISIVWMLGIALVVGLLGESGISDVIWFK